eukprot:Rmarinus@m.6114
MSANFPPASLRRPNPRPERFLVDYSKINGRFQTTAGTTFTGRQSILNDPIQAKAPSSKHVHDIHPSTPFDPAVHEERIAAHLAEEEDAAKRTTEHHAAAVEILQYRDSLGDFADHPIHTRAPYTTSYTKHFREPTEADTRQHVLNVHKSSHLSACDKLETEPVSSEAPQRVAMAPSTVNTETQPFVFISDSRGGRKVLSVNDSANLGTKKKTSIAVKDEENLYEQYQLTKPVPHVGMRRWHMEDLYPSL